MWATAFRFMKYDLAKMLGILAGIIIAVFLIGEQLGIFAAMMNSMKGTVKYAPNYIWVVSEKTQSTMQMLNMDVRSGRELQSVPGITQVIPLVVMGGSAKFANDAKMSISLIGLRNADINDFVPQFMPGTNAAELANEGAVFMDNADRAIVADIKYGDVFQINDQRVYMAGFTKGMTGFGAMTMVTTLERAKKLSGMSSNYASAFLVKIDSTLTTEQATIDYINHHVPLVKAWNAKALGNETLAFMMRTSNIAVSFGLMVLFALIAGFAIVGLTLYSSVNDRIRDYGTIKAIGGHNGLIRKLILYQAALYALFGFLISFGLLKLFSYLLSGGKLEVSYSPGLIGFLVVITLAISMLGCLFALRKIIKLEPVQIFRM